MTEMPPKLTASFKILIINQGEQTVWEWEFFHSVRTPKG